VGYYFILFPRTKQCLIDNRVTVINKNLQKLSVTYTICYRYLHHHTGSTRIKSMNFTKVQGTITQGR
jgi:hypothetical protein